MAHRLQGLREECFGVSVVKQRSSQLPHGRHGCHWGEQVAPCLNGGGKKKKEWTTECPERSRAGLALWAPPPARDRRGPCVCACVRPYYLLPTTVGVCVSRERKET